MKNSIILFFLIFFYSCTSNNQDYIFSDKDCVIFKEDSNEKDVSFEPSISEVEEVEIAFRDYLNKSKKETLSKDFKQRNIPELNELKYYKRRYFGRINIEYEKVIKVEYIFNRCLKPQDRDNEEWKKINYLKNIDSMCWFSFSYNLKRKVIYGL